VLYTDGVLEARNESGELYGFARLSELFAGRPSAEQVAAAAVEFGQDDDITVVSITRLEAGIHADAAGEVRLDTGEPAVTG
jgi:serine phosphatase RsbU (regulator of sigma subunit)